MTMPQKNKLRVIELFGGIGTMTQALKRLGIDFEIVDYVEIDKYAVASYNAMNDTNFEPQDITKWGKPMKCSIKRKRLIRTVNFINKQAIRLWLMFCTI